MRDESAALALSPVALFRRLIVEPLRRINEATSGSPHDCILLVVDAIDEGEFHRNENGESIAWLVRTYASELPKWVCRKEEILTMQE